MKKIVLAFSVALLSLAIGAAAFAADTAPVERKLKHGYVQVYDLGPLTLHAYQTADLMADEAIVLETGKNLVAIESPPFTDNIAEWKEYLNGLGKPLTDILISYHPAGGKWYGQAKSHATEGAKKAITAGPTKALTESLGQSFGTGFITDIPDIEANLTSGLNTVGGIEFDIIDAGDGYDIAIPAINVIYTHMLGADTHSILAGPDHLRAVLASLENMKKKGYQLILSSHHTPEKQADVDTKIAYVKRVQAIAAENKTKDEFIAAIKKEYPDYQGDNYLDMTAGFFYGK
ncbi:hypothetical protein C4J81_00520 [Deltaproteobacteria bacterium Smac51]|nr:hypothetical protein C4J81_00520 [Deltaproteobacteria bacterium Smac51]